MKRLLPIYQALLGPGTFFPGGSTFFQDSSLGLFDKHGDIGLVGKSGAVRQVLARMFGGQGTINVPSWSPDSRNIAFVSYRLVSAQTGAE
jgi:hypothetical protein